MRHKEITRVHCYTVATLTIYTNCRHKSHIFNLLFAKITKMNGEQTITKKIKTTNCMGTFLTSQHYYHGKRMNITSIVLFQMHIWRNRNGKKKSFSIFSTCVNCLVMETRIAHTNISIFFHIFIVFQKLKKQSKLNV